MYVDTQWNTAISSLAIKWYMKCSAVMMESYQLNNILIKLRLIWPYSILLTSEVHTEMIVVPLFSQKKRINPNQNQKAHCRNNVAECRKVE